MPDTPELNNICKIINDRHSWVMEVDGKIICFHGVDNAEYFAEIFEKLGKVIVWDRDKWKQPISYNIKNV